MPDDATSNISGAPEKPPGDPPRAIVIMAQRWRLTVFSALALYALIVAGVNAGSVLTEHVRRGAPLPAWEPLLWEYSSAVVIILLFPAVVWLGGRWPLFSRGEGFDWRRGLGRLAIHIAAALVFSTAHVGAMVMIRKAVYAALGRSYEFGPLAREFPYELRKDAVTYVFILAVVYLGKAALERMAGLADDPAAANDGAPASANGQDKAAAAPQSVFTAKRRGETAFLPAHEIEWFEAAGNYVALHTKRGEFLTRTTLAAVEARLDPSRFLRIHRSAIVNRAEIEAMTPTDAGDHELRLKSGKTLRYSRRFRAKADASEGAIA